MEQVKGLKPPMTYDEQIQHLQTNHGLTISDPGRAKEILKTVNYYRLSAYGIDLLDKRTDRYHDGTTLEQMYLLYLFDSRLRNIIGPVIEYIEVKFRSSIAYYLAIKYGAECYRDRSCFQPWFSGVTGRDMFEVFNEHVDAEIKKQAKNRWLSTISKNTVAIFLFGLLLSFFLLDRYLPYIHL